MKKYLLFCLPILLIAVLNFAVLDWLNSFLIQISNGSTTLPLKLGFKVYALICFMEFFAIFFIIQQNLTGRNS